MTSFWSISIFWIAILLLVAVALAFVLPPLLRSGKDRGVAPASAAIAILGTQLTELDADLRNGTLARDQYADARRDIEEQLRDMPMASAAGNAGSGRWAGFALGGIIPVAAIALYLLLGSPEHLLPGSASATAAVPGGQHDPAAMVATLEDKLKQRPDDGAGWAMLGRSYLALGRFDDAANALARAAQLTPNDARLLADYAEAAALTQDRNMAGLPSELVTRALAINDRDDKALMLAGVAASQRQDFAAAAAYWRRLLNVIPPDSPLGRQVATAIAGAEDAEAPRGGKSAGAATSAPAQGGKSIAGTLSISGRLAARVSPSDSVFIFAQAPQGPPMPLAVKRITAGELPYRFRLDDSTSMSGADRLSSHHEVLITARVSKSGQAMPQSGDLQGRVGPVKLGRQDVALAIDSVLP